MVRGIRRFIVATAAGAGLGAGAALIRRRAVRAFDHPDGPGDYVAADDPGLAPHRASDIAASRDTATSPMDRPSTAPEAGPRSTGSSERETRVRSEIEAITASVADLEEARDRLRRRAARLRAEMEEQGRDPQ